MGEKKYVVGVDYGTDSVRSVIVDTFNGKEISSEVFYYPRWKKGLFCNPSKNQFRQHPLDYIEGLEKSIKGALLKTPKNTKEFIVGLSIDTTGSTPCAVNENGIPLSLTEGFETNPNAMFVLWKDHTSVKEADEINKLAHSGAIEDFTKYVGGVYSSEWFWAKILHVLREDENVKNKAFSWVEHCDWIPALITGNTNPLTLKRGRCSAGHKAMWHESFDGLPSENFLTKLDPLLKGLRDRLYKNTYTVSEKIGNITPEWAKRLGLTEKVSVGVGAFDAHIGAIGGEIDSHVLSKIMGTSTCDILVAPMEEMGDKLIKGICGQVNGSVIPGMLGMEAGQSAFGDIYAWFKNILIWPFENIINKNKLIDKKTKDELLKSAEKKIIDQLSKEAEKIPIGESGIIAIDWMNGRRTPYANQLLKGAIINLNLASDAPKIFKALVEATAFGAKKIIDCFTSQGVKINSVIALGGVAKKSPYIMQVVSDVLNMNIKVAKSEQTCALGAAMCAAVVSGVYSNIKEAQKAMGSGFEKEYKPNPENTDKYNELYDKYSKIGNFIENEITG
jgi:L-ribulokinase